jgi:hypothetical protein
VVPAAINKFPGSRHDQPEVVVELPVVPRSRHHVSGYGIRSVAQSCRAHDQAKYRSSTIVMINLFCITSVFDKGIEGMYDIANLANTDAKLLFPLPNPRVS